MARQSSGGARRGSGQSAKSQIVRASPTLPGGTARTSGAAGSGSKGASGRTKASGAGSAAGRAAAGRPARASSAAARQQAIPGSRGGQSGPAVSRGARPSGSRPAGAGTVQPAAGSGDGGGWFSAIWAPVRDLGAVRLIIWVLSLFGLGVSTWLTITHFDTNVTLACPDTGFINCAKVTTSAQSEVFGVIPVAVLGLAFYGFMSVVNSPWFWARTYRWEPRLQRATRWVRLGSVAVGMCFVLYLISAELLIIKNICLWCTSIHVTTFLIFSLLVFYTAFAGSPDDYGA